MKKIVLTTAIGSTALVALALGQGTSFKTGLEVMQAQDNRPQPKTQIMTMSMEVSRGGAALNRSMKSWSADGGNKTLIKFLAPADVKGAGFLIIKKAGITETQLWLPALGRVRRLSSSDNGGSFFGSDLSNEDISGSDLNDYDYKLLESKNNQYIVEAKPKLESSYSKVINHVDAKSLLTSKAEFYKDDEIFKTLSIAEVSTIKNFVVPRTIVVETLSLKSKTTLKLSDVQLDVTIPDETFSERNLKK
jgi:hypothetical protein